MKQRDYELLKKQEKDFADSIKLEIENDMNVEINYHHRTIDDFVFLVEPNIFIKRFYVSLNINFYKSCIKKYTKKEKTFIVKQLEHMIELECIKSLYKKENKKYEI